MIKEKFHSPEDRQQKEDIYSVLGNLIGRYEQVTLDTRRLQDLPKVIREQKLGHLELTSDETERLRVLMGNYIDSRFSEDSLQAMLDYLHSLEK